MEQQQFRVSLSIGKKLLISFVALIFVAVAFLNLSAIFLLREDKRAYVFASQTTQVSLAGREFVSSARHAIDTLRLALGSIDPLQPPTPQQKSVLQSVVGNQSDVITLRIMLVDVASGRVTLHSAAENEKEFSAIHLQEADLAIPEGSMRILMPELTRLSFAFINLSKPGGVPVVGVLAADTKLKDNPTGMPVAMGLISLADFGKSLSDLKLTVATRTGWMIFDTDPARLASVKNIADDPLFRAAIESKVASGTQENRTGDFHYLGSFVSPGFELVALAKTGWDEVMRSTYTLTEKTILLGAMVLGLAMVFAILFSKTLTAPINRLFEATKEVARGRFDLSLNPDSKDEIGALTDSFNVMSKKIVELIKESMEKVQLENELAIASTVQQTLLPDPDYEDPNLEIRSLYRSASQCGGDWWGFFRVGSKVCVMIADATGHGLPSALITASARSCFSVLEQFSREVQGFKLSPASLLHYANRVVHDASKGKIMMTFFIGVMDFDKKELVYSSAGHNPPWLFKKDGGSWSLKSLTANGTRLGEGPDSHDFEEKTIPIAEGDLLFLYTDGLLEGKNAEGTQYGKKHTRQVLEAALAGGPQNMINTLMSDFMTHNGDKPLDDDVTLAVARIK